MAKAKKLPSGNWRVQVFSHTENGKKVRESITAPTKREAELKAAEWLGKKKGHKISGLLVKDALQGYIKAKEGVLSPSTIRGYNRMFRNNYAPLLSRPIKKLTTEDLQIFVSDLAGTKAPKTVANVYGLLSSSLSFYMPDVVYCVTLPKKVQKKENAPSNEDVQLLFNSASPELKKCIALAAFGSLRRGEIAALTYSDLKDGYLTIDKDVVETTDNKWILKEIPKTDVSVRMVSLPDKVIELLGTGKSDERIVKYANPSSITGCFTKLRNRLDINICFHDLRHFYASIGVVLGCSDIFLADTGGWVHGSNSVMKKVYQNSMADKNKEYSDIMKQHFDNLI